MKKNGLIRFGVAGLVLSCTGIASAQSNGPTGLSARIGLLFPTSDSIGGTWFAFGADYKLNSLPASLPAVGSIGYFGLSADYYSSGGNSNIPVVLNYNLRTGPLVYSIGAGLDFYDIPSVSGSGTGFDAQAAVSYDITSLPLPIFLQAKYFLSSRSETRGIGIYAGVRF